VAGEKVDMNNYEKLDRLRLTAEHIRVIKTCLTQAWGKLFVAANLLNQSPEFQRVSFDPSRNIHFRVTRQWLKDAVNRYPELRLAQLDAEESMLDMIEFQAIQQAIGTKTAKPNLQAIQFLLTTQGKKRGYGFAESEDSQKYIQTRIAEILNQATPDAIIQISKISEFTSVTKRIKQMAANAHQNEEQIVQPELKDETQQSPTLITEPKDETEQPTLLPESTKSDRENHEP
jgi:hypothetical protein